MYRLDKQFSTSGCSKALYELLLLRMHFPCPGHYLLPRCPHHVGFAQEHSAPSAAESLKSECAAQEPDPFLCNTRDKSCFDQEGQHSKGHFHTVTASEWSIVIFQAMQYTWRRKTKWSWQWTVSKQAKKRWLPGVPSQANSLKHHPTQPNQWDIGTYTGNNYSAPNLTFSIFQVWCRHSATAMHVCRHHVWHWFKDELVKPIVGYIWYSVWPCFLKSTNSCTQIAASQPIRIMLSMQTMNLWIFQDSILGH